MSSLKLSWKPLDLTLEQPFTISRDTKRVVNNVFVCICDSYTIGYGEAAPNIHYNEDAQKVVQFFETIPGGFFDEIETLEELSNKLDRHCQHIPTVQSARAAIEMAWLDWWGKKRNKPVWKLWDAPSARGPVTSFTIGLDEIPVMQEKVKKASDYPIYKVKLGTGRDRDIIQALREVTDKPIRVDANEGWTRLDQAVEMVNYLAENKIEMVEQPMPAEDLESIKRLRKESLVPLCADESFMGDEPIDEIAQAYDIINIKVMKTGSLYKARDVIDEAREAGLQVMIGCMIESSLANSAGALLSLWADYCDLDGHLLIKNDPAEGISLTEEKQVKLSTDSGLGITWNGTE